MKQFAIGRLRTGVMNKTEEAYSEYLEQLRIIGDVLWWKFEGLKFRLADNTFYTPDFVAMRKDGQIECHEVKGFWHDDARAKIKIAADMYPFQFCAIEKIPRSEAWKVERF